MRKLEIGSKLWSSKHFTSFFLLPLGNLPLFCFPAFTRTVVMIFYNELIFTVFILHLQHQSYEHIFTIWFIPYNVYFKLHASYIYIFWWILMLSNIHMLLICIMRIWKWSWHDPHDIFLEIECFTDYYCSQKESWYMGLLSR
jgi:hypothetical protein